ncbi:MAG TPA: tetratricopeptide repeat protein [Thermoanaerobaculia bacterium]|nr:tetratricopeptide repeat protein [Thermoanaerobaculia bacterium]
MKRFFAAAALVFAGCASSQPAAPSPAETRLVELQTSMTELLERMDVMNARLTKLEESRATATAVSPAAPAPAPAPVPAPARPGADTGAPKVSRALAGAQIAERYRGAIVLYGQNRFEDARAAFQAVFNADSSGELADNALFWIGETYFAASDWGNAMSYYRRVAQDYSDQNKAPDALYKLAVALIKTGDLALARQTLQDVISRYPYSAPAASAKAELNRIKY